MLAAYWAQLDVGYRYGASSFEPHISARHNLNRLQHWLTNPMAPDGERTTYLAGGFLLSLGIMLMRVKSLWWRLHPAGYAVSSSHGMKATWFMFFLAWFIKWMLLKRGGLKAHRSAIPFFLGLVFAEVLVGSFWALMGVLLKKDTFSFTAWW